MTLNTEGEGAEHDKKTGMHFSDNNASRVEDTSFFQWMITATAQWFKIILEIIIKGEILFSLPIKTPAFLQDEQNFTKGLHIKMFMFLKQEINSCLYVVHATKGRIFL